MPDQPKKDKESEPAYLAREDRPTEDRVTEMVMEDQREIDAEKKRLAEGGRPRKQRRLFVEVEKEESRKKPGGGGAAAPSRPAAAAATRARPLRAPKSSRMVRDEEDSDSDSASSIESAKLRGKHGARNMLNDHAKRGRRAQERQRERSDGMGLVGRGDGAPSMRDFDRTPINENVNFASSVGGLKEQLRTVLELVVLPLTYPELFRGGESPRGVLFAGPPGCGKTLVARALAGELQGRLGHPVSLFVRKGADLLSKYVGQSESHIRQLFQQAQACQPSIIFFDEIDGLAPVRNSEHDHVHASVVTTLLAMMDGLTSRGQVLIIAATNRPDAVDPALRRPGRFDKELFFPAPDQHARAEMISLHTKQWPKECRPGRADCIRVAAVAEGYSGADMRHLAQEARAHAVRRSFPEIYHTQKDRPAGRIRVAADALRVSHGDWDAALASVRPSAHRLAGALPVAPRAHLRGLLKEPAAAALNRVKELLPGVFSGPPHDSVYSSPYDAPPVAGRLLLHSPDAVAAEEVAKAVVGSVPGAQVQVLDSVRVAKAPAAAVAAAAGAVGGVGAAVVLLLRPERWWALLDAAERESLVAAITACSRPGVVIIAAWGAELGQGPAEPPEFKAAREDPAAKHFADAVFGGAARMLVPLPADEQRRRFWVETGELLSRPPPTVIRPDDLRPHLPIDTRPLRADVSEEVLKQRRQDLIAARTEAVVSRTMLRSELLQLVDHLSTSRQSPPSACFASASELAKKLKGEMKEGTDLRKKMKPHMGESVVYFISDIGEKGNEVMLTTVQMFIDNFTLFCSGMKEFLAEMDFGCSKELITKVRATQDHVTYNLHQLNPTVVFDVQELWTQQRKMPDAPAGRGGEKKCCPACKLDDWDKGKVTCVCCAGSWHMGCVMPEVENGQDVSKWRCPRCEASGRRKARGRAAAADDDDDDTDDDTGKSGAAVQPFQHPERGVKGVDMTRMSMLAEKAKYASDGMAASQLGRVWEKVYAAAYASRMEPDKRKLLKEVTPFFEAPKDHCAP